MLSDGQLITALTGLFKLNRDAKKLGVSLERTPRTIDDEAMELNHEAMELNHEFKVFHRGVDTGYYVQVGMGEMSLDHFDGDGSTEIARLDTAHGFATPMTDFVATVINTAVSAEKAA